MLAILVAVAVVLLFGFIWNKTRSRLTHIPGPSGIPIAGNALEITSCFKLISKLHEWMEKYGEIFKINIFGDEILVVSGALIGEMLVTKGSDFAGRPKIPTWEKVFKNEVHLVLRDYDPKLRFIRKLVHKGLRQYGEGMDKIEAITVTEIGKCLDKIDKLDGADFDPFTYIHHSISQVMNTLVTGEAVPDGHPMLNKAIDWDKLDGEIGQDPAFFLPAMEKMSFLFGEGKIKDYTDVMEFFIEHWRSYEATYDKENMRGLYDVIYKAYLESETDEEGVKISYNNVKYLMFELYGAGIITTHKAIYAFVHMMVTHPGIQKRIQAQIDDVIGSQRNPTTADKRKVPLLEATIHETLRYISHVPFALPHETKRETSLGGFAIPNKTQVWPFISGNHYNPKYFKDPLSFNPDRFLEHDGSVSHASSRRMLTPFGAGPRNCVGEVFARTRLFLFTASLLQRFRLLQPNEGKLDVLDPKREDYFTKLPNICPNFKIRAIHR
ncbi:unnamed protein product [Owenia fusiformis]|uniref:unspecific monooxygenase n=1 Tax=Owenia fusiformis TaxID=6347 RepID=A0A8S4NJZ7_OWEFU|nr:unnamed protein product [Owenia fusiformis]